MPHFILIDYSDTDCNLNYNMIMVNNNESFNKYLLNTYYFVGTVVDVGNIAVKKMTSP